MKISSTTKGKISAIKEDAAMARQHLAMLLARLSEHAGTKKMAAKLERVINRLDDFQRL